MFIQKNLGFTLIEILMAMAIFVVGSASIWSLYIYAVDLHKQAEDEQKIAWLAESILAELRQTDIVSQAFPSPIRQGTLRYAPEYTYDVDFINLGNDAIGVTIHICRKRYGQIRSYVFQTVVYAAPPKRI